MKGDEIFNSLCRPTGKWTMEAEALRTHGITVDTLKEQPTFKDLYPILCSALANRRVLIYNADFDIRLLNYACELNSLEIIKFEAVCLMDWRAQWINEWSDRHRCYRWQPLGGGHRAIEDCQTALIRLKEMAADTTTLTYPDWLLKAASEAEITLDPNSIYSDW